MLLVVILLFESLLSYHQVQTVEYAPVINTRYGPVLGTIERSMFQMPYYAYRGIPYAKAPIHDRRFEPPEPMGEWTEILNVTDYGPVCPQAADLGYENMSEDCLTLNIFTKSAAIGNDNVLVFINGDAFNEGAAMDVGPDYFMDNYCVLVTLNYRMNIFGFISTGTRHAPGNVGLKDQALALQWINENINFFGGNPNTITLLGHGAGSMSATLHFVSRITSGAFKRVILMSGSALSHYPLQRHNLNLVNRQAEMVGCSNNDIDLMLKCLKRVDFRVLAEGYRNLTDWGAFPYKTWFPVIERYFGQARLVDEDPIYSYRQGRITDVPFLIGVTRNETSFMAHKILSNEFLLKDFEANFTDIAPICFLYEKGTQRSFNISQRLRQRFFMDGITNRTLENLFSDSHIRFGTHRTIDLLTLHQNFPIYVYQSSYRGNYSHVINNDNGVPSDVMYGDDLQFLFPLRRLNLTYKPLDPDTIMVIKYTRMWLDFAQKGSPLPSGGSGSWPTYNKSHHIYMDIDQGLTLKTDFPEDTIRFWEELFPLDPVYDRFDFRNPEFWSLLSFITIGALLLSTLFGLTVRLFYVRRQAQTRANLPRNSQGEQNQVFELEETTPVSTVNDNDANP